MKSSVLVPLVCVGALSCSPAAPPPADVAACDAVAADAAVTTLRIPVEGMTCAACAAGIKVALRDVSGVKRVEVRLAERDALVEGSASAQCVTSTIEKLGYKTGTPTPVVTGEKS